MDIRVLVSSMLPSVKWKINFSILFVQKLILIPSDTFWIDTGATTQIGATMEYLLSSRALINFESYICVGNGKTTVVEAIGIFRISLETNFIWN